MGGLADLLKWRDKLELKDNFDKPLLDDKDKPIIVYMRIVGDDDLKEAYKYGRIESSSIRKALKDDQSLDSRAEFSELLQTSKEELVDFIVNLKISDFTNDAVSKVERADLPELEEYAVDPDAPKLEEQEALDKAILDINQKYVENIQKYIDERSETLKADLLQKEIKDLQNQAKEELIRLKALDAFMTEVNEQKIYRACYLDKTYKTPAYDSLDDFKAASSVIRNQLFDKYHKMELGPDEIKK